MDADAILMLLFVGAAMAGSAGFAAAWWSVSRRARRLERILGGHFVSEDRLREMEEQVAGLQGEIDKMRQDHQFLSRLLANRVAKRSRPAEPRQRPNTPV
jgi:hypothetical protein